MDQQLPVPQSSQTSPSPQPPPMKKFPMVRQPLIGLILFLCAIGLAFSVYSLTENTKKVSVSSVISPTPTVHVVTKLTMTPTVSTGNPGIYIHTIQNNKSIILEQIVPQFVQNYYQAYMAFDNQKYIYFIDGNTIFRYDLDGRKTEEFVSLTIKDKSSLQQITFIKPNILAVSEIGQEGNQKEEVRTDNTVHLIDITTKQIREVTKLHVVFYGGNTYITKTATGDIIGSFGGDGCGGWGSIYMYEGDTSRLVTKTGVGCSKEPRFVGAIPEGNSLLLYAVLPQEKTGNDDFNGMPFYDPDVLYYLHTQTGAQEAILDLKPFVGFKEIVFHDSQEKILISTKNEMHIYNLLTKKTEKIIPYLVENLTFETFTGDVVVARDYNNHKTYVFDTQNGNNASYTAKELFQDEFANPALLGIYKNQPLFSVIVNKPNP
jgi:hypothetical protein